MAVLSLSVQVRWYDGACFAIVGAATLASLWVLFLSLKKNKINRDVDVDVTAGVRVAASASASAYRLCHTTASASASAWRGVHPGVLLVFRLGAAAVLTGVLGWDLFIYDPSIFLYYTEWTFLLVILYFLIGAFISAHGLWVYSRQTTHQDVQQANGFLTICINDHLHNQTPLLTLPTNTGGNLQDGSAGTWGYCMQIIYQTCGGAVMLTDVVFWCLLVPFMSSAHFKVNLIMGCMHSLNLLFLLVDTFLNSMPFPWFGMTYFILWSCTYVIFQWILHACGFSWWPYPFLELATPWAPLWYFCMALVHIPCYGIYWLIVKAKNTHFPKLFPHSYVGMC
ncbi:hypothetical protein LUZ61_000030 [Rhynchospora tenuis]|uniref:Uncharacterized protein n=1 Tax=Rhynchospora tenuis TaxID=198213 RepID=A0AAD6EPN8_9POAL|nr:hypothetical protein LUZ61_000030 [Rhynchospora tenuis]